MNYRDCYDVNYKPCRFYYSRDECDYICSNHHSVHPQPYQVHANGHPLPYCSGVRHINQQTYEILHTIVLPWASYRYPAPCGHLVQCNCEAFELGIDLLLLY